MKIPTWFRIRFYLIWTGIVLAALTPAVVLGALRQLPLRIILFYLVIATVGATIFTALDVFVGRGHEEIKRRHKKAWLVFDGIFLVILCAEVIAIYAFGAPEIILGISAAAFLTVTFAGKLSGL